MMQWLWAIFHGPARQRAFLVEQRSVMELTKAGLNNRQLRRSYDDDRLGVDDLIAMLQTQIDTIDRMLKDR